MTESRDSRGRQEGGGESLSSLLDEDQLSRLVALAAEIAESMRQMLCENFDAECAVDSLHPKGFSNMTNDEKMMVANPSTADIGELEEQRRLKQKYDEDINSPRMIQLQQDSFEAFDKWRKHLMQRVQEAIQDQAEARDFPSELHQTSSDAQRLSSGILPVFGRVNHDAACIRRLRTKDLYPPIKNVFTKLAMDRRTLILHSILLLILSLKQYSAYSRVFLLMLTSSFKLPLQTLEQDESVTAYGLLESVKELTAQQQDDKPTENGQSSRKWRIGLATAAGVAVVGVAGGIAAPLVAAGVNSVLGGLGLGATSAAAYLGSVSGNTYLVGSLFGAYGGRMTSQMMENYAKEVEGFKFIPINSKFIRHESGVEESTVPNEHRRRLRVTICVSGWLTEKRNVTKPWEVFGPSAEVFALEYELDALLTLGNAMNDLLQSASWGYAQKQLIEKTIFADLAAAMWPIGLAKAARLVDNPFSIAKVRSDKAGRILADALIDRAQGERPVTLIGYSLGARVIYKCLMSLVEMRAFGLIENVVLLGAPAPSDASDWRMLRTVVSGRLINVFSTHDYVLSFMYRTSSLQYGIAGLQAIKGVPGVENFDVSCLITGHLGYQTSIGLILRRLAVEDLDRNAIAAQQVEGKEEAIRQVHPDTETKYDRSDITASIETSLAVKALQYLSKSAGPRPSSSAKSTTKILGDPVENPQAENDGAESLQVSDTSSSGIIQKAYRNIPSMPWITKQPTKSKIPSKNERSSEATTKVPPTTTYASKAAEYLPSVPRTLPTLSALTRHKKHVKPRSEPRLEPPASVESHGERRRSDRPTGNHHDLSKVKRDTDIDISV